MDDSLSSNPYKTLGIPKDATLATIRSAHRKLVLSCHPDKVQDEAAKAAKAEQFHQVQQSYEILSDESRRQRYDEKVKLAELRAEMADERGSSRKSYDYGPPKPWSSPVTEVRGARVFERVPKSRIYEDEVYTSKYADTRTPSKKYEERYATSSARRSSARAQEESKKARAAEDEEDRRRRVSARQEEERAREVRDRQRDRDRRKESEAKSRDKFSHVEDVDDDSDSDYAPRRKAFQRQKYEYTREREEPKRNRKREVKDLEEDAERKEYFATNYIHNKSKEVPDMEPPPGRRPARTRTASHLDAYTPPVDSGSRSAARGHGRSSRATSPPRASKRDKFTPEIVDPPSSRRPSMPVASSDSKGLKNLLSSSSKRDREPQRSATYEPPRDFKPTPLRRAETLPIHQIRRSDTATPKSTNLKTMVASDSEATSDTDSDTTEDSVPPKRPIPRQMPSTTYKIHEDDQKVYVEPKVRLPQIREISPKNRRSADRPAMTPRGTSTRPPPMPSRSASYAFPPENRSPRQTLSRTDSARPAPIKAHTSLRGDSGFFDDIPKSQSPTEETFKRKSPKIRQDDRYNDSYSRRSPEDTERDSYPGSHGGNHARPYARRFETAVS